MENADVGNHLLTIGGERKIGNSGSPSRRIAVEAFYRNHSETNFDRDDGLDRFDDGQSIADRYSYQSAGAEVDLKNRIGPVHYAIGTGGELRDYEDLPTVSTYDMMNYWFFGDIKFPLSNNTRLRLGYEYYVRDFDERLAKDSNGDASTSNPALEYQYHGISAGLKHRFNNGFVAEVAYFYTIRNDSFVDYNSYTRSKIVLGATFNSDGRMRTGFRFAYRDQQYPNAFAFDNPGQPQKEYQELEAILVVDYQLTDRLSLRADFKREIVESSDPRGEYDRLRGAISVHWGYQ